MLMAGLEHASSGQITALGLDITVLNEDALARFRRGNMGVVFQSFHLIPTMTALENVATPLELAHDRDAFTKAEEALEAVGLVERKHHYPAQRSGGEQQRVARARAAAPRPKLLLADEPTGNLDEANSALVMDLLFSLQRQNGSTLVLVTHSDHLAQRCDRVIRLRDGRIEADQLETAAQ
jgi:putative ABC transport system ATP-binding protein